MQRSVPSKPSKKYSEFEFYKMVDFCLAEKQMKRVFEAIKNGVVVESQEQQLRVEIAKLKDIAEELEREYQEEVKSSSEANERLIEERQNAVGLQNIEIGTVRIRKEILTINRRIHQLRMQLNICHEKIISAEINLLNQKLSKLRTNLEYFKDHLKSAKRKKKKHSYKQIKSIQDKIESISMEIDNKRQSLSEISREFPEMFVTQNGVSTPIKVWIEHFESLVRNRKPLPPYVTQELLLTLCMLEDAFLNSLSAIPGVLERMISNDNDAWKQFYQQYLVNDLENLNKHHNFIFNVRLSTTNSSLGSTSKKFETSMKLLSCCRQLSDHKKSSEWCTSFNEKLSKLVKPHIKTGNDGGRVVYKEIDVYATISMELAFVSRSQSLIEVYKHEKYKLEAASNHKKAAEMQTKIAKEEADLLRRTKKLDDFLSAHIENFSAAIKNEDGSFSVLHQRSSSPKHRFFTSTRHSEKIEFISPVIVALQNAKDSMEQLRDDIREFKSGLCQEEEKLSIASTRLSIGM